MYSVASLFLAPVSSLASFCFVQAKLEYAVKGTYTSMEYEDEEEEEEEEEGEGEDEEESSPSVRAGESVSLESRMDYAIFGSIVPVNKESLIFIMEAKYQSSNVKHAIAQVCIVWYVGVSNHWTGLLDCHNCMHSE